MQLFILDVFLKEDFFNIVPLDYLILYNVLLKNENCMIEPTWST